MGRQYLVLGAGRFGSSVAKTLYRLGHDVMVVDSNEDIVQEINSDVTNAVQADATSEKALAALDIKNYDAVVLAVADDMQTSIMAAILLVEMKAHYIVAKAQTDLHGRVLNKIGVNRVVYPEMDMGKKLAHSILAPSIIDLFELSEEYSVVEVKAPKDMTGKSLKDLDLRARHGVSVIALRNETNQKVRISPIGDDIIGVDDIIVAIGDYKSLKKLEWI
ncbi:MAG: potassium channel family protein [Bacillota bacterium]